VGSGVVPLAGAAVPWCEAFGHAPVAEAKRTAVAKHAWYTVPKRGRCKPKYAWRPHGKRQPGSEAAAERQRTWMGATNGAPGMGTSRGAVELVAALDRQGAGMDSKDWAAGDSRRETRGQVTRRLVEVRQEHRFCA